jgi:GNAT superfamily N-acetyltransferase
MTDPLVRHQVHRANTAQQAKDAAALIATAFSSVSVSEWVVPDVHARVGVLASVFEILVGHALDHGEIHLITASAGAVGAAAEDAGTGVTLGAAVWFHAENPVPPPPDYDARLRAAAGDFTPRFAHLDDLLEANHPPAPHHYLAFLAVRPALQNAGIGETLLRHHHSHLDAIGMPGYLEASSLGSRRLYLRHGYHPHGQDFAVPSGALFYPLWRPPTR